MDSQYRALREQFSHDLVQVSVRVVLLLVVSYTCLTIFSPFASLMLWGLVLAVTLYPIHLSLTRRMGGKSGRAATLITLVGVIVLVVPMIGLGLSFTGHVTSVYEAHQAGTLALEPPTESVKQWPLVGERLYSVWLEASQDLPAALKHYQEPVGDAMRWMLNSVGSTLSTEGLFVGALIVAGIMMAYGESGSVAMSRIARTILGPNRGEDVYRLSTLTIRSVAMGVVGVALIQALILGVIFMIAGIPAAGVLALITLVIGIIQLPALILTIPVIAYLWGVGDGGTVFNSVMTVLIVLGGVSDGVLKPILLGRGVDVPMPVVLIGALGGMVAMGMIGLFLGAVILSVGYRLLMNWVDHETALQAQIAAELGADADAEATATQDVD